MRLVPAWNGMFQGAFKHQALIQGTDRVWYVRRPDIQLPVPPLPIIDVPYEILPDLRDVYGIDAEGNLYVQGERERDEPVGDRRIRCLPAVGYGEADESLILLDHELGHPFHGHIALAPTGHIVAVSNLPSFLLFGPDGSEVASHRALGAFEAPPGREAFWEIGAGDVACGADVFAVGGAPLDRIDVYGYDGAWRHSLDVFELEGKTYDLAEEKLAKVAIDRQGRVLGGTARRIFAFEPDGRPAFVAEAPPPQPGAPAFDFHLWIAVDDGGRVWSQFYKGKEVAFGAFDLGV